ncbi:MAG: hypothetical protein ABSC33_04995 [Candidatus Sulfotelmatobacter sp.]|jgi:hypothetical protein
MSADSKKGYGSTLVMMILGLLALYGGAQWLVVLIPGAVVVWYAAARTMLKRSRN